jgi:hypothetical protein
MKRIRIFSWIASLALVLGMAACEDTELTGPSIDLTALENGSAKPSFSAGTANGVGDTFIFLEENDTVPFQSFSWMAPDLGAVTLPFEYTLQLDVSGNGDFEATTNLLTTTATETAFTVGQMNLVLFNEDLPIETPSTVHLRIRAEVKSPSTGTTTAPIVVYSDVIALNVSIYSAIPVPNYATVGIIGSATTGDDSGWNQDIDMRNPNEFEVTIWKATVYLYGGFEVKFRANDGWDVNWGDTAFPEGVGTAGGPNIPITESGVYDVTFNDETGEYSFAPGTTIGIIGSATPGGWDTDTDMTNPSGDGVRWELTITLTDGEAKFRQNDSWSVNWGGGDFPSGTATLDGPNIPVTAGTYKVTFNSETGAYNFGNPTTVAIIGSATPNGWDDPDTDMLNPSGDLTNWEIEIDLVAGEMKFRQNNSWSVNWGATDFPTGTATQDGQNIPITTAGKYFIKFNSETGEYSFAPVTRIGIIGSATPGGWDTDTDMFNPSGDDTNWELTLDLVAGEVKFRADNGWDVNWGDTAFPSGTGTAGGPNIPIAEAGTYKVTFNSETGAYNFEKQ